LEVEVSNPSNPGGIDPCRLYSYEEIAEFIGDVSWRRVRRWVEEGKMPYTLLPAGRGRRISGQQYLDFLKNSAVAASD
jgi:excisionase family DNA binding protein